MLSFGQELPYMENGNIVTADQIARHDQPCSYAPNFLAVDLNNGGGKAFLKPVYEQYAEWGVDFGTYHSLTLLSSHHYCRISINSSFKIFIVNILQKYLSGLC